MSIFKYDCILLLKSQIFTWASILLTIELAHSNVLARVKRINNDLLRPLDLRSAKVVQGGRCTCSGVIVFWKNSDQHCNTNPGWNLHLQKGQPPPPPSESWILISLTRDKRKLRELNSPAKLWDRECREGDHKARSGCLCCSRRRFYTTAAGKQFKSWLWGFSLDITSLHLRFVISNPR